MTVQGTGSKYSFRNEDGKWVPVKSDNGQISLDSAALCLFGREYIVVPRVDVKFGNRSVC